jgi:hypothetical protein
MKLYIIIACIFFSLSASSQTVEDSIKVPVSSVINAAETIRDQADTIFTMKKINSELVTQNTLQSIVIMKNESEISLLTTRVTMSDGIIDRYKDHLMTDSKRWYEHRVIYFIGGIATAVVSSIIIKNAVD